MGYFKFVLKDNNVKIYKSFSGFLFFLHVAVVSLIISNSYRNNKATDYFNLSILFIYIVFFLLYFFFLKKKYDLTKFTFLLYIPYTVFWIKQISYWTVIIPVLIGFIEFLRSKKSIVIFRDDYISIRSLIYIKKYIWTEISNVILKDDLLTIDFKSNKIFQEEIIEGNININNEFDDFIIKKLRSGLF